MNSKMNKLMPSIFALMLLALGFSQCGKKEPVAEQKTNAVRMDELFNETTTEEKESLPYSYVRITFPAGEYGFVDAEKGVVSGSNGNMIIDRNDDSGISMKTKCDIKKIFSGLDNYIRTNYSVESYNVIEFEHLFYGKAECVFMRFSVDDSDETHSVLVKADTDTKGTPPVIIQCEGQCGDYECAPYYDVFCGEVRCNCEECSMKVTVLD